MKDNITFSKIWEDGDIIELKIVCSSSVATITSQIYVSDSLIDELICQIKQFLDGNIEEGLWANEDTADADNVGIRSLYIIRLADDTDPQFAYRGDEKYTPGININKTSKIPH